MKSSYIFIGPRAFEGIAFHRCVPLKLILCRYGCSSIKQTKEEFGIDVLALDSLEPYQYCERLDSPYTDNIIDQLWSHILFETTGCSVISNSSADVFDRNLKKKLAEKFIVNKNKLCRSLDNKILSRKLFNKLGLHSPKLFWDKFSKESYAKAMTMFGSQFIVKKATSSSGSAMVYVTKPDGKYEELLETAFRVDDEVLYEEYITGIPINVNAVVFNSFTQVYKPSVQLIGVNECTSYQFGFCGNDYSSLEKISDSLLAKAKIATSRIGDYIRNLGYRGIFGVDYICTEGGNLVPCEINPRFQNSTAVLNWSLSETDYSPALLHLRSFEMGDRLEAPVHWDSLPSCDFSQIIVYYSHKANIGISSGHLSQGRYKVCETTSDVLFIESTLDPTRLRQGEFLVTGCPPVLGSRIMPGCSLFRIILKGSVTNDGYSLSSFVIRDAISKLRDRLNIN